MRTRFDVRGPMMFVVATLATVSPLHAQPGTLRVFRDWALGCDVSRSCIALGTRAEDTPGAFVHLERGGASRDSLRMTIGWWAESAPQRAAALRVLAVTTKPGSPIDTILLAAALPTRKDTAREEDDDRLLRLDATAAPALPGVRVRPFTGAHDRVADSALGARLRRRVEKQVGSDCDTEDAAQFDEVEPLSASQTLIGLNCSRGAYNLWSRWSVVTNRNVQTARPAVFMDAAAKPTRQNDGFLVNGGYDAASGKFGAFSKGRGLGDCGSMSEWGWDGSRFVLLERREINECRGVASDWWPITWRARQTP